MQLFFAFYSAFSQQVSLIFFKYLMDLSDLQENDHCEKTCNRLIYQWSLKLEDLVTTNLVHLELHVGFSIRGD